MKIIKAKTAGFCFGVQRAVSICEDAAGKYPGCVTLGPIIHNERVVRELEARGVNAVRSIDDVQQNSTVIIRSHGAGQREYDALRELGAHVIDATCPYVSKIHEIVRAESQKGRLPVIIGKRTHPEVTAISGWCRDYEVFEDDTDLHKWLLSQGNNTKALSFVFQTTNTKTLYNSCVEIIKKECTNHEIFDTICDATCKRQQEAAELSKIVDVMVVTGGRNSANSLRLADICREHCSRVIFAEGADDIELADIRVADTVGVTAGASTPAWIIKEVILKMNEETVFDETTASQETQETNEATEPGIITGGDVPETVASPDDASVVTDEQIMPESAASVEAELEVAAEAEPEAEAEVEPEVAAESEPVAEAEAEPEAAAEAEPVAEAEAEPEIAVEAEPEAAAEVEPESTAEAELEAAAEAEPEAAAEAEPETTTEVIPVSEADEAYDGGSAIETDSSGSGTESFEEMLEKSIKTLHTGEKVTGIVTSVTSTEVSVDLGTKQSGYIPISEFMDDSNTDIDDIIKIGDSIETFVMRVNDVEGMVMLSKKRLDAIRNWDDIEAARESKTVVEGIITEENKGGVVANVKGVRVFIPASQTGLPKSTPMTELLRKNVRLRITEVNQSRRRVVGSIRIVQQEDRREKSEHLWNDIEAGKQYDGVVKSMTSYGVFVDIGGVDGMIHISELSWTRIKQPSEVMSVGDEVSVYVLSFDKDNRKISLGYKRHEDNPWTKFVTSNSVGDVVNVKIVKMMPFGAFAEIYPGVDGLIHISQITDHRIGLPSEVLTDGQLVNVKITEIDNDRKKVSLSIRALIDPSSQPVTDKEAGEAASADNTPVIVYDTDSPPEADPDGFDSFDASEEYDSAVEPEITADEPELETVPDAPAEELAAGESEAPADEPEPEPESEPAAAPEADENIDTAAAAAAQDDPDDSGETEASDEAGEPAELE